MNEKEGWPKISRGRLVLDPIPDPNGYQSPQIQVPTHDLQTDILVSLVSENQTQNQTQTQNQFQNQTISENLSFSPFRPQSSQSRTTNNSQRPPTAQSAKPEKDNEPFIDHYSLSHLIGLSRTINTLQIQRPQTATRTEIDTQPQIELSQDSQNVPTINTPQRPQTSSKPEDVQQFQNEPIKDPPPQSSKLPQIFGVKLTLNSEINPSNDDELFLPSDFWNSKSDEKKLIKAIWEGNIDEIRNICDSGKDIVNQKLTSWGGLTPLMFAVMKNKFDIVKLLTDDYKSNVDDRDNLGKTALMLAAEEGHLEIGRHLVDKKAQIDIETLKGETAIMLATIFGHLDFVKWLIVLDESQARIVRAEKNILMLAAQHCHLHIVDWILNSTNLAVNVNAKNPRELTALHYSCSGSVHPNRLALVRRIIAAGAEVNLESKHQETPLHWAASFGYEQIVEYLLDLGSQIDKQDADGNTALMRAAQNGHEKVVETLVSKKANKSIQNHSKETALQLAWKRAHIKLATEQFMNNQIGGDSKDEPTESEFSPNLANCIAKSLASNNKIDSLIQLARYAAFYNFHFDFLITFVFPLLDSPIFVLNHILPDFYNNLYQFALENETAHPMVFLKLIGMSAALRKIINRHSILKEEIQHRLKVVDHMIAECACCESLDLKENVIRVLQAGSSRITPYDLDVDLAQRFLDLPMRLSMRHNITCLFGAIGFSSFVEGVFWSFLRKSIPRNGAFFLSWNLHPLLQFPSRLTHILELTGLSLPSLELTRAQSENIKLLKSNFIYFRYCPALMMLSESICKIFVLILIYRVINHHKLIDRSFSVDKYTNDSHLSFVSMDEVLLTLTTFSIFIYEYGALCSSSDLLFPSTQSAIRYFSDTWNFFEYIGLGLVIVWGLCRYYFNEENAYTGHMCLSTSAIFFSISILHYFTVYQPLGKLIIMFNNMILELRDFAILFGISLVGFAITVNSLFPEQPAYSSLSDTILTLIQYAMGNISYSDLDSMSPNYELGVVIVTFYLFYSCVVLLNLVIARMSATHDEINSNAFQSWEFDRAINTNQYLLVEERNPLCMLPPPLNLIPSIFAIPHVLYLTTLKFLSKQPSFISHSLPTSSKKITPESELTAKSDTDKSQTTENSSPMFLSISGTISDITVGILLAPIAPFLELSKFMFHCLVTEGFLLLFFPLLLILHIIGSLLLMIIRLIDPHFDYIHFQSSTNSHATSSNSRRVGLIERLKLFVSVPFVLFFRYISNLLEQVNIGNSLEFYTIVIFFPIIYPFYVLSLLLESLLIQTHVTLDTGDGKYEEEDERENEGRYRIHYPLKKLRTPILRPDQHILRLEIPRAELKSHCSNPIVRIQIGGLYDESGESVNGSQKPYYTDSFLNFPIEELDLNDDQSLNHHPLSSVLSNPTSKFSASVEVVDRNPRTGYEIPLGRLTLTLNQVREWVMNRRFEYTYDLEGNAGSVRIHTSTRIQPNTSQSQSAPPTSKTPKSFFSSSASFEYTSSSFIPIPNPFTGLTQDSPNHTQLNEKKSSTALFSNEDLERIFSHAKFNDVHSSRAHTQERQKNVDRIAKETLVLRSKVNQLQLQQQAMQQLWVSNEGDGVRVRRPSIIASSNSASTTEDGL